MKLYYCYELGSCCDIKLRSKENKIDGIVERSIRLIINHNSQGKVNNNSVVNIVAHFIEENGEDSFAVISLK